MANVLVLSGLDPTGSAGISADILAINNTGSHALPIISVITVQNTQQVGLVKAIDSTLIIKQLYSLCVDVEFEVIKIGLIVEKNIAAIEYICQKKQNKIILDPIINSSTNNKLGSVEVIKKVLPKAYLITPNLEELLFLTGEKSEQQAIKQLKNKWVLVTKTDNSDKVITHNLYNNKQLVKSFIYKKLANNYHGSGCVLSATIASFLAQNISTIKSCQLALDYTYQTLLNAKKIGKMQLSPQHNSKYGLHT